MLLTVSYPTHLLHCLNEVPVRVPIFADVSYYFYSDLRSGKEA